MSSNVEAYHWGVTPIHALRHAQHPMRYGDKRRTSLLGVATGFFYENEKTIYLITNRHVAVKEKDDHYPNAFEIFLHTSQESIREVRVAHIPLYDENIEPLWIEYPHLKSTFIDIIAINLKNYLQDRDVTYRWSKKDEASRSQILSLESNIRVIGYPLGFHDDIHHVPISRHATVASPYGIAFRDEPYYLIDSVLHSGMSGSPVIIPRSHLRVTGHWTLVHSLLGIYSGGWSINETNLGLGAVWYPDIIQEIITENARGKIQTD